MALNSAAGLAGMLKAGHKHMEGVEGATLRNVEAAKGLATIVSSSLGPNGMNKLVINHLEKIIVTSDCATIVRELEIQHPAAKMLELAAEMQEQECGDGTNLCVSFAGELLKECEDLLRMGLHTSEIVSGYKNAAEFMHKILPSLCSETVTDFRSEEELVRVVTPVLSAKQFGYEKFLAPLVAKACMQTFGNSSNPTVNSDSVRIAKIMGGNISQSEVINGMVVMRGTEGSIQHADDAKISVFACGIEASATEAKGTVLMNNADDLMNYNKSEERKMDEIIKSIADTGTKVVISGGTVSEMAMHFIERYGMMCVKIPSKWELKRICSATGSTALVRLGPATADELGYCDEVNVKEIGGRKVVVFSQQANAKDGCRVATILLRASTESVLNDIERAIDDGVNCIRTLCTDGRLVPGAGATEMELSRQIKEYGDTCPGLDQYAIRSFAKALQFVPKTLAENSGQEPTDVIAALGAAHNQGEAAMGVDIFGDDTGNMICQTGKTIVDLLYTKESALRLSIDAAITVLRVDQIIMSKPAQAGKGV
jgi:T-complex protein 1 subunit theta